MIVRHVTHTHPQFGVFAKSAIEQSFYFARDAHVKIDCLNSPSSGGLSKYVPSRQACQAFCQYFSFIFSLLDLLTVFILCSWQVSISSGKFFANYKQLTFVFYPQWNEQHSSENKVWFTCGIGELIVILFLRMFTLFRSVESIQRRTSTCPNA